MDHDQTCRKCGKTGSSIDEFLSPYDGLCVECSPNSATNRAKEPAGYKLDAGKLRMDLVPPEAIEELAKILTYGATGINTSGEKAKDPYPERNWERGMKWSRVFAALNRHLWSWWAGEDIDPESGHSHMSHVLCNAAFLATFVRRGGGDNDDRPVGPPRVSEALSMQFERTMRRSEEKRTEMKCPQCGDQNFSVSATPAGEDGYVYLCHECHARFDDDCELVIVKPGVKG